MCRVEHLMCAAAFTVLVAFSAVARAEAEEARSDEIPQPMTCAQATAFAWFKQQMALPDVDEPIALPAECERTHVADRGLPSGDREVFEESK